MNAPWTISRNQTGFSMLEVLVTLVILLLGVHGLLGMMLLSQRAVMESYQRAQALILLQDIVERINANRTAASCYAITTDTVNSAPYLGVGSSVTPACSAGTVKAYTLANNDLTAWNNLLIGTSEQIGTTTLGAMIGARGCISLDATTGVYLVSVAWQGIGKTAAPGSGLACGKGLYGDETLRRVVSVPLQIASLN